MKSKRCVYLIRNLVNGRIYVGSTINFPQRKWRHLYDLKKGKHCSRFMQRDFNKCGGDAFVIEVLEVVSETDGATDCCGIDLHQSRRLPLAQAVHQHQACR